MSSLSDPDHSTIADHRRFYVQPEIALSMQQGKPVVHVVIGSGYRAYPLNQDTEDHLYMIDDPDALGDSTSDVVTLDDLADVTDEDDDVDLQGKRGWYIRLLKNGTTREGEKVVANAVVVGGVIYVPTYLPETAYEDRCNRVIGSSRIYGLNIADGPGAFFLGASSHPSGHPAACSDRLSPTPCSRVSPCLVWASGPVGLPFLGNMGPVIVGVRAVQSGFSLMELVVAIAVAAIVVGFGIPAFTNSTANANLRSTTMDLIASINGARAEAVNLRADITLESNSGDGDWGGGWKYDHPNEGDREFAVRGQVTVTEVSDIGSVVFNAAGTMQVTGASELRFHICDHRPGITGREITVNRFGRLTNEEYTCP